MKIVHILPNNPLVCGGIKVHYQLCHLEKELGYDSYIAYNDPLKLQWFYHTCNEITFSEAKEFLTSDDLIVGWEDPKPLYEFSKPKKVAYIQGDVFFQHQCNYVNISLWYSSWWNMRRVGRDGKLISPFIDPSVFFPSSENKSYSPPLKVLIQERKAGKEKWDEIKDKIGNEFIGFVLKDVSEVDFADNLRRSDIFFSHSYPEGFGLPALEAMASGTLIIGYPGGGGTDFMRPFENCFTCNDGNSVALINLFRNILNMSQNKLQKIVDNGKSMALSYSSQKTKEQLSEALDEINRK
jgi:glycosyltransferase involved in cell wall biosynthesis